MSIKSVENASFDSVQIVDGNIVNFPKSLLSITQEQIKKNGLIYPKSKKDVSRVILKTADPEDSENIQKAVSVILHSKGFLKEEGDSFYNKIDALGEVQGSLETRLIAGSLAKYYYQAFSLEELNNYQVNKYEDLRNYFIIKLKYLAHSFSLKHDLKLPGDKKETSLEGFHESFTIPRIAASFEKFGSATEDFDKEFLKWIMDNFLQTTISEILTENEIDLIAQEIQAPDFVGPIILGSGYDWHFTGEIFFGNFLLRCNRGKRAAITGVTIYEIDRSVISPTMISTMAKRQENGDMPDIPFATSIYDSHEMPKQMGGHCTENSAEAILVSCLAIKSLINAHQIHSLADFAKISKEDWKKAFAQGGKIYKKWNDYDSENILDHFFVDCEEALKSNSKEIIEFYTVLIFSIITEMGVYKYNTYKNKARELSASLIDSISEKGMVDSEILHLITESFNKKSVFETSKIIQRFEITNQPILNELAISYAQKGEWISCWIKDFGITDQKALIKIAKIAAERDSSFAVNIQNYGITDPKVLIKLAKIAAKKGNSKISENIKNFGITDQKALIEIAKIVAKNNRAFISKFIKNFGITDQKALIEIAKIAAENKDPSLILDIKNYGITDPEALIELAMIMANKFRERFDCLTWIKKLGINDPDALKRIELVCQQN